MVEAMTKVVSDMTVKECPKTSWGIQYKGVSNYVGRQQQPPLAHGADGTLELNTICYYCKDTRHMKDNCNWLNNKIVHKLQAQEQVTANKAQSQRVLGLMFQKIIAPHILTQSKGDKVCSPDRIDKTNHKKWIVGLIETISSQQVSAQIEIKVM